MTYIRLSDETIKKLRLRKVHNSNRTYDQAVSEALDNSTNPNKGQHHG